MLKIPKFVLNLAKKTDKPHFWCFLHISENYIISLAAWIVFNLSISVPVEKLFTRPVMHKI